MIKITLYAYECKGNIFFLPENYIIFHYGVFDNENMNNNNGKKN